MSRVTTTSEAWATLTPADLFESVTRRAPSLILTTLFVTMAAAAVLFAWPNRYASDGLFYVRLGRGAISVDPTTQPSGSVSLQESRRAEVISISEMMRSREITDRVVRSVGVRRVNEPRTWVDHAMQSLGDLVPPSPPPSMDRLEFEKQMAHEMAVKRVREAVDISVPKNGYTVSVLATDNDPKLAQAVVQAIMDEYGAYHVEAHRSTGSLDFFEQQADESQRAALEARTKLQQVRNELGWMSAESAETTLRERILQLELSLDAAESDLADSESLVQNYGSQLEEVEQWIPMEVSKVANNAADDMRTVLYEFQVNDGERLSKVTPSHPRHRMLQEKLSQGKEIVSLQGTDREETREAINPVHLQLETDYQLALGKTAGLRSRCESLRASLREVEQDLQRLNHDMIQLAELTWNAEITEQNFLKHAASLESARVVHELDNQQMSDVSVIQQATLNLKKVGPPRLTLLMIAAAFGLCLGVLQALVRDNPLATALSEHASSPGSYATEVDHLAESDESAQSAGVEGEETSKEERDLVASRPR